MLKHVLDIAHKAGTSAVGIAIIVIFLGWIAWVNLGPGKPEVGAARSRVADQAILEISEDLRASRGGIGRTALLHFGGDHTDYFTDTLRSTVENRGILDLQDIRFIEKLRKLLNLRIKPYPDPLNAIEKAGRLGVEGVIFGGINYFESYPGGARINVDVSLADVPAGKIVFTKNYDIESKVAVPGKIQETAKAIPWFRRFLYWLVAVLLLPVFSINFIRTLVSRESNIANAFVLGTYTLIDVILAWLLVGAALTAWFPTLVFVGALAAALLYNIKIIDFAIKLEYE